MILLHKKKELILPKKKGICNYHGSNDIYVGGNAPSYPLSLKVLMHMQGDNNASVFTDEIGHSITKIKTPTGAYPITSDSQVHFGTTSGYFPGTSALLLDQNTAFGIGTSDYAISLWAYLPSIPTLTTLWSSFGLGNSYYIQLDLQTSGAIRIVGDTVLNSSSGVFTTGVWNWIAFSRTLGRTRLWLNGSFLGGQTITVRDLGITRNMCLGVRIAPERSDYISATNYLTGYINEFRCDIGSALNYTSDANISVPTSPF